MGSGSTPSSMRRSDMKHNGRRGPLSERKSKSQKSSTHKIADEPHLVDFKCPFEQDVACLRLERQNCALKLDKKKDDDFDFAGSVDLLSSPQDSKGSQNQGNLLNLKAL